MEIKLTKNQLINDILQADYALTPYARFKIHTSYKDIDKRECLWFADQINKDEDEKGVVIPWDDVSLICYETETDKYTVKSPEYVVWFQLYKLQKNYS